MFPILPQDAASNALGPFPPELPSDVAKADNQAIEDLNSPRVRVEVQRDDRRFFVTVPTQ